MPPTPSPAAYANDDEIDFSELFSRVRRGLPLSLGLACIGLAIAAVVAVTAGPFQNVSTSTRVVFSFPGFERGEYPDKSKFTPDDVRSPEIIAEALKRKGIEATDDTQAKVRAALSIEGIIPDTIVKERDRQRAAGQTPRVYIPDEYSLTLTLPRKFPLSSEQRAQLLGEIVSIYQEKFTRNYVSLPLSMGKAFESLTGADYFDYDIVLRRESDNISSFLTEMAASARAYRSPRTNLTFSDLLKQSQIFTQIKVNEVLGLIRQNGLSRDRKLALVKMDYYLKTLGDEELRAMEEEKVVQALLKQTQDREQKYTLGLKAQSNQSRTDGLVVDQNLVDSLLANDSYNFLVRQALEASLRTRRIQSEKTIMQERRNIMEGFVKSNLTERTEMVTQFTQSLGELRKAYEALVNDMRVTYEDYQKQQFGDAIRISMQAKTKNFYLQLGLAGIAGLGIGGALGLGLSLLGIGFTGTRNAKS